MSTAQDSPRRYKRKARRAKQLAAWREKNQPTQGAAVLSDKASPNGT